MYTLCTSVDIEDAIKVKDEAKRHGWSTSQTMRCIIKDYFYRKEKNGDTIPGE